jgi:hypothetical protein
MGLCAASRVALCTERIPSPSGATQGGLRPKMGRAVCPRNFLNAGLRREAIETRTQGRRGLDRRFDQDGHAADFNSLLQEQCGASREFRAKNAKLAEVDAIGLPC